MLNRIEILDKLVDEGFSYKTLSSFSDSQMKVLGSKLLSEEAGPHDESTKMFTLAALQKRAEMLKIAYEKGMLAVTKGQEAANRSVAAESSDIEGGEGTKTVDTDNVGNPDVDIKKPNKKTEKLITDKEELEEVTSEMVETWMTQVVNKKDHTVTKSDLIEMVKNIQEDDIGGMTSDPEIMRREYGSKKTRTKLFSSVEQEYAFEQLNKYVLELDGYEIKVDELESGEDPEEDILNLFLESESGIVWDIIIYTDGNIYMDGAPIQDSQDLEEEIREKESGGQGEDRPDNWRELPGYNPEYFYDEDSVLGEEEELSETERDTEGAYMGAPVGTEMPAPTPVKTPTTTPTRPGRKRGPFTRPKTTPKPKAGKDKMPEWMGFDDIKSQVENS